MATTNDHLKECAMAIVDEIYTIPIAMDGSHKNKRRRLKEKLLQTVPHHERWQVDTYVREFIRQRAASERSWNITNSRLFAE